MQNLIKISANVYVVARFLESKSKKQVNLKKALKIEVNNRIKGEFK